MKKKNLLIIILTILLIGIILGSFLLYNRKNYKITNNSFLEKNEDTSKELFSEKEPKNKTNGKVEITKPLQIIEEEERFRREINLLYIEALESGNVEKCEKIPHQQTKEYCKKVIQENYFKEQDT